MKILVSWLREYVEVPVGTDQLASDLMMRGFEVASIEPVPGRPDDAVIDFEITANRPDCLSVFGMAREVSVAYGTPLRMPDSAAPQDVAVGRVRPSPAPVLRVTVERADLCPVYCAAVMDVSIGPSPAWLAERLVLSGVRPINLIVDVTNYVLLELNQPLHAFDHATVGGAHLMVRTARDGEPLTTLDGQERTLSDDMLVIADQHRAQAVAGVMGGAETGITPTTSTIVIESACFEPAQVRRTRRRLGLSTEASYRFERGTDPSMPAVALRRAVALIADLGAGTARPGVIVVGDAARSARRVSLRWARIGRVLGMQVPADEVERILTALGFVLDGAESRHATSPVWEVTVPGWRGDVTREEDLIEEVARCAGYDRLPVTYPSMLAPPARVAPRLVRDARIRDLLVGAGFAECVTFTFIEQRAAAPFDPAPIAIANPLSELFAVLRPSVLPGLIDALSHNRRREQRDLRLFELGTRFTSAEGETRSLAVGWTGAAAAEHWSGSGRAVDVYDVIGLVQRVAAALHVRLDVEPTEHPALVSGRAGRVVRVDADGRRVPVGLVGDLAPTVAEARGLPTSDPIIVAEVDLDLAAPDYDPDRTVISQPLPRHPSVIRDLSIVVPADLPAARVRGTIHAAAPPTLVGVREFDRYQGTALPAGSVSLSLRLTFRATERTLTDGEVHAATDAIVAALVAEHGAALR
ncbi:MAG: phenylalanine--tRNA ligase subunit beta [Acidobacteria bacterium]|nr:phenylalanine--tRNA ligase subunit beta [Acidobacteriota bacterium]